MDLYLLGGLVVSSAAVTMTITTNIRQKIFMPQGKDSSADVDSYTGLIIFAIAVTAMALIPESRTSIQNAEPSVDFAGALREMIKLTLGAVGALYLKSGYDKHDKAWKEKHQPRHASTGTTRKTTLFYHDETCGDGDKLTANTTPPNTP